MKWSNQRTTTTSNLPYQRINLVDQLAQAGGYTQKASFQRTLPSYRKTTSKKRGFVT